MISRREFLFSSMAAGTGMAAAPSLLATIESQKLLALTGTSSRAKSYFIRMFPRLEREPPRPEIEKGLKELGEHMTDDNDAKGDGEVDAGYTYFGQFIDHDLTLDLTSLDRANPDAERTPNFRTPFLDLDQLYGEGPNLSPFLYRKYDQENSPHGAERFLIGKTKGSEERPSSYNDLPRNPQGIALVGDPRQDENLILAQLHVAFLKFHNFVLDGLKQGKINSVGPEGATPFDQARRLVTWHYQWIVRYDFLKNVIDPELFDSLERRERWSASIRSGCFQIPIEFSIAAFRFGHSMVRDEYEYNCVQSVVPLKKLLERTGSGPAGSVPLPEEWVISWDRFFRSFPETNLGQVRKIDTKISGGLHRLDQSDIAKFNVSTVPIPGKGKDSQPPALEPHLPVRTLLRGARVGLPSGRDVARELARREPDIRILKSDEIANDPNRTILVKHAFHKDTPLWFYILKEAEVLGSGRHLGPVGSRLVATVILGALAADPNSYVSAAPKNWSPTLCQDMPSLLDLFVLPNKCD